MKAVIAMALVAMLAACGGGDYEEDEPQAAQCVERPASHLSATGSAACGTNQPSIKPA
jgi:hypothetical protein